MFLSTYNLPHPSRKTCLSPLTDKQSRTHQFCYLQANYRYRLSLTMVSEIKKSAHSNGCRQERLVCVHKLLLLDLHCGNYFSHVQGSSI